jgi:hypothetical protein
MPSPDQGHKSDSTSLDAERARLRSAGHTDAEVSQILIASASQQPAAAGQGALSNVLSSILGVASHARALIPTFRKDVETVFDGAATASARAGATASLAVKAIVVIVLGYAAYQEWSQHIVYAPTTARNQSTQSHFDACAAATKAAGETMPGNATSEDLARVHKQLAEICGWNLDQDAPAASQVAEAPDPDPPSWARFWRITRANFTWTSLWHALALSLIISCGIIAYAYISMYAKRLWSRLRAPRAAK